MFNIDALSTKYQCAWTINVYAARTFPKEGTHFNVLPGSILYKVFFFVTFPDVKFPCYTFDIFT